MNEPPDARQQYRAVVGPDHDLLTKELKLFGLLADEVEARLPSGLSELERERHAQEIVAADPILTGLATELVALAVERSEPAFWEREEELPGSS